MEDTRRDGTGFDPNNTTSGFDNQINITMNSGLVWNCEFDVICPSVSKSWEWSADGTALTFHLRDDVKFADGKMMDAADVKWTFEKMMGFNPDFSISARVGWMTNYIIDIEVVDDHTVQFNTFRAAPALIRLMAVGFASVLPNTVTADMMREAPRGVGPFSLAEHIPGSLYRLVRNDDYFEPEMPYLDEIHLAVMSDRAAIEAAFLTGKLDINNGAWSPSNLGEIEARIANGQVKQFEYPGGNISGVYMAVTNAPWDDVRVRKAVNLAIDRDQFREAVYDGDGVLSLILNANIPNQGRTEEEMREFPGFNIDKEADRAEARKLLAEAGFPDGFDTTQQYRISGADPAASASAVFIQDQLAKVGIRTEFEGIRDPTHFERFSRLDYNIQQYGFAQQTLDPDELFGQYLLCDGSRNWTGYCSDTLQAMFVGMSSEQDPVKRGVLAREMEDQVILTDAIYAPLPQRTRFYTWYSNVHPHADGGWYISWYMERKRQSWWKDAE